ncbi:MAG: Uncharacterised protein [Acidimicrobiaceae bacterium]|nr:MAG: Uncharacterised protein [Acidimicrobiaceae bacterium]
MSTNCPTEPKAVATPKAKERRDSSTSRPMAARTTEKDAAAIPNPMSSPPPRCRPAGPVALARTNIPTE